MISVVTWQGQCQFMAPSSSQSTSGHFQDDITSLADGERWTGNASQWNTMYSKPTTIHTVHIRLPNGDVRFGYLGPDETSSDLLFYYGKPVTL